MFHNTVQHFVPLLACDNPAVVTAALQALLAFVRRSSNAQSRWPGEPLLNARLAALLQGWGGKAEVRGTGRCLLASCAWCFWLLLVLVKRADL
jgi:hypothetical protein